MILSVVSQIRHRPSRFFFFFFNDTATTEIYTLSLHDALPISTRDLGAVDAAPGACLADKVHQAVGARSEEHTSELQSHLNLVCRLLLEKKKNKHISAIHESSKKTKRCIFVKRRLTLHTHHS